MRNPSNRAVQAKMAAVRAAFRWRRLARQEGRRLAYCVGHSQLDEARKARATMLEHLRKACRHWRTALGIQ